MGVRRRIRGPTGSCRRRRGAVGGRGHRRLVRARRRRSRPRRRASPTRRLAALDASGLLGITVPGRRRRRRSSGSRRWPRSTRILAAVDPAIAQVPQAHYLCVDVLAPARRRRSCASASSPTSLAGARGSATRWPSAAAGTPRTCRPASPPDGAAATARKYYCTGALTAAWIAVSALDEDGRLVLAFVPRDAPGRHGRHATGTSWASAPRSAARRAFDDGRVGRPGARLRGAPSRCRSSSARGPSSCTRRSRSASPAARCATRAPTCARRPGRPPRRCAPARRPPPTTRTSCTGTGRAGDARRGPPRRCCATPRRCSTRSVCVPADAEAAARGLAGGGRGQGVRQRGRGRGAPASCSRCCGTSSTGRQVRPRPALAQRPHPQRARPGGLEVPPHRRLRAGRRAPAEPRADLGAPGRRRIGTFGRRGAEDGYRARHGWAPPTDEAA